jgi:glucose/arabinose dehydrogenase
MAAVGRWTVLAGRLGLVAAVLGVGIGAGNAGTVGAANVFDPASFDLTLEKVADGFDRPIFVADPADGSERLFVVEQGGTVRILRDGEVDPEPFLDMSEMLDTDYMEQGLLGLAFDPEFERNGRLYVGYTAATSSTGSDIGDNSIARLTVSGDDPDRVDPSTAEVLIAVPDPFGNHNGGEVIFGPDGYLYAAMGDGGAAGDPQRNGQNPQTLLGSILRIDVRGDEGYAIPADNPFADGVEGRPEIWAYGLRNPWRFSFDRETNDMWIADVGQDWIEEINFLPAGSPGGANFGWRAMEGSSCYEEEDCDTSEYVLPVAEYTHDEGCSVTGGYVYRGEAIPELDGVYLLGDYCVGAIWGVGKDASGNWVRSGPVQTGLNISSFGEDADGNVYLTASDGALYRIAPSA